MLLEFGDAIIAKASHRELLWKRFVKTDPIDLDGETFVPWSRSTSDNSRR
jgi:hypothetical protein